MGIDMSKGLDKSTVYFFVFMSIIVFIKLV